MANALAMGAAYGFLATVVYDVIRPLLKQVFHFQYPPFRAITVFGSLITGLPMGHPFGLTVGWIYHFWNGISFAMMYVLVRPRGGLVSGWAWGLGLQLLMLWVYPSLLKVRLDDPGFLTMGIVGHSCWGLVLGWCVQKRGHLWAD